MIKAKKLILDNFMNISHAELDFQHDIISIFGKSKSGKSAAFEAMYICLSTKKRGDSYFEYIKQGCNQAKIHFECDLLKKPAIFDVVLNLEKGGAFEITFQYENEVLQNTAAKTRLKELDIEYYVNIMFSMQEDQSVAIMSPADRAAYLAKLMNFSLKTEAKEVDDERKEVEKEVALYTGRLDSDKISLEKSKERQQYQELPYTDDELRQLDDEKNSIQLQIEEIEVHNASIQKKQEQVTEILSKKSGLGVRQQQLESLIVTRDASKKDAAQAEEDVKVLKANLKKEQEVAERITSNIENTKTLSSDYERISNEASKNIALDKVQLDIEKEKLNLINEKKCPHCGQPTDKLYDASEIEAAINTYNKKISENESVIKENEKSILENDELIKKLKVDLTNSNTSIRTIESNISQKNRIIENKIDEDYETELEDITKSLKSLDDELAKIGEVPRIKSTSELVTKKDGLNKKISDYFAVVHYNKNVDEENKKRDEDQAFFEQKVKDDENTIAEGEKRIENLKTAYEILNKRLPSYMANAVYQKLSVEMNKIIHVLFPEYNVSLEPVKTGCELYYTLGNFGDAKNNRLSAKMSSGFEKALLNLSFKLALSRMYGLNLFVGDEIDKAGDVESSQKLFELLISLKNLDQIFLISHKTQIEDIISNFDDKDSIFYHVDKGCYSFTN